MVNSRPIRSTRSQVSIAIAIRRTTIAVAPASQGSASGPDQIRSGSASGSGLTVPSTWPIRLRIDVPVAMGPHGVAEALLRPAPGDERRGLLGQQAGRVGHGHRVVCGDLEHQVPA